MGLIRINKLKEKKKFTASLKFKIIACPPSTMVAKMASIVVGGPP